ncbi:MAG TPA: Uma2 family endonuclease [Cytophagaceae bacterium]|jgi:Uma2 family endonuclease|nr:Uma2 family endonuclease [Cytophagaceae bacterium]
MDTFVINTDFLHMSEDEFFRFCQDNDFLKFERTADKQIIVMTPTGTDSGIKNSDINFQLTLWNKEYKLGYVFDSSSGFTLPNSAVRSPDASWIKKERYDALDKEDVQKFGHICPDFVIELVSKSDRISDLKLKMEEWITNGCKLGWLIDPKEEKVYIYKPLKEVITVEGFDQKLSGEDVLPDFVLELKSLR